MKIIASAAFVFALLACRGEVTERASTPGAAGAETPSVTGPLTPGAGVPAPDFTLASHAGTSVTLSESRGRNVILVFYRGHW